MGTRRDEHIAGVVVPVVDLVDYVNANDSTSNNSSYTEATPRPGTPVPSSAFATLVPVISGGQDADLVLSVLAGGAPGITAGSAALGYRYDSEASDALRGWTAPNGFDDWDVITYTTSATTDAPGVVVDADSQRVLVGYGNGSAAPTTTKVWDPETATWSSATSIGNLNTRAIAFCQLPSGRVIAIGYSSEVYRSDNFGTTWTQHSTEKMLALDDLHLVYMDGELLAVGLSGTTLYQLASSDGGSTFTEVEQISTFGTKLNLSVLPDGRAVLTYRRNADGYPCARVIPSAWSPLSGASVVVVNSGAAVTDVVHTIDTDGFIWVYYTLSAAVHTMYTYVSRNGGESFGAFDFGAATVSTSSADSLVPMRAVSVQGQVMLISKFVASTDTHDPSICSLRFGGWTNAPYAIPTTQTGLRARAGFGPHASLTPVVWLPIELPNNAGWTAAGAGTGALSNGRLNISTSASARSYSWLPGAATAETVRAGVKVNSGGSVSDRSCCLTVATANGSIEYRIDLRLTTTGFRAHDPFGSAGAGTDLVSVNGYDLTAETDFLVHVEGGTSAAYVLYKRPYEATWTEAWRGTLTTDGSGAAAGGITEFGHIASGTADSDWRYVARCETTSTTNEFGTTWGSTPLGRPISSIPVPLHGETSDGTRTARLSAIGGIGAYLETFTVAAAYDYPIEAVYPQLSPSPSAPWRSTDTSEQILAFTFDYATHLGEAHPCIIALGCNFQTAYLEYLSGTWQTYGTLNLATGFDGINYTRSGSILTAGSGGVTPSRYLKKDELKGGHAIVETGSGADTTSRKIAGNDAGYWSSSTSDRKTARIFLEGSMAGIDASGQCSLIFPSGVHVVIESSLTTATLWRIRIPASQDTSEGYYTAGILTMGALHVPGAPPDWGYSEEVAPHIIEHESPAGVTYRREVGCPTREITFGWSSGTDLTEIRASGTDGDWMGIASKVPMASMNDVVWWSEAMLRLMRSGEVPCAWLKSAPTATATVNDSSLIVYGRLVSSVGADHESGDEDTGEIVRPISWTIRGIE